jgi:hypothetical protein
LLEQLFNVVVFGATVAQLLYFLVSVECLRRQGLRARSVELHVHLGVRLEIVPAVKIVKFVYEVLGRQHRN